AQGMTNLTVMVATHPHADHIGGLVEVMQGMPVGQMWTSGASHTTQTYERFLDAIDAAKIPYHEAAPGDTIPFGTSAFDVLHARTTADELNDTSLVVRLQHGDVSFLLTGDAEAASTPGRKYHDSYATRGLP
ncbi:MAG TPA: MBL fold metallo-hydrolase, partial [Pseudoxanthomonas sp.]|nr:MBL fold metallo-hydrolase [Pseudoxanthomonas sp.]